LWNKQNGNDKIVGSDRQQFNELKHINREHKCAKIIINDAVNLFLTAIGILALSNHNSFRVLFDKIAFAYFI